MGSAIVEEMRKDLGGEMRDPSARHIAKLALFPVNCTALEKDNIHEIECAA